MKVFQRQVSRIFLAILCSLSLVFLVACATAPIESFPKIKNGMQKGDVIELIGSPHKTERKDGVDIWQYTFYEREKPVAKIIYFKENRVSYAGAPLTEENFKSSQEPSQAP